LIKSTDLSRFGSLDLTEFMTRMVNQIANFLGYATVEGYIPINENVRKTDKASRVFGTFIKNKA